MIRYILLPVISFIALPMWGQKHLTIAAAANVQFVIDELKKAFEKDTGIPVDVILNSSGKLTAQIIEGAPYDVFVSADVRYPRQLYNDGFARDQPKVYASGVLVLWTMSSDIKPSADLKLLTSGMIRHIAVANPDTAPYGLAAEEALKHDEVFDKVKDKLVFGESISQTNQYILSRSADIGFTAKSIVMSEQMTGMGRWVEIDQNSYHPIEQAAIILEHGRKTNRVAAENFYNYLYSAKAKAILKHYGYLVN